MHDIRPNFRLEQLSGWIGAIFASVIVVCTPACLGDQVLNMNDGEDTDPLDDDDMSGDDDGSGDADGDGDGDSDSDSDADGDPDAGYVLDGDYSDWVNGEDDWAPGEVVNLVEDESHTGFLSARCFGCHGEGKPFEPETSIHDPRMQYWSFSCARGFPGGTCHGHGINGAQLFNHDFPEDPYFLNCTKALCHDEYNTIKDRENHGYMDAPDPFCNACHQWNWEGWPDDVLQ